MSEDYIVVPEGACVVCDGFGCEHCPDASSHLNKPRKWVPRELAIHKAVEEINARRDQAVRDGKAEKHIVIHDDPNHSWEDCEDCLEQAREDGMLDDLTVTVTFRFHNETHRREFIRAIRQHPNVESLD